MNTSDALDSDAEIVRAARSGDQNAYEAIISRYRSLMRSVSRSYFVTGSADEDLYQEALIGLIRAVRDFAEARGPFRKFLQLCVERQVITYIKSQTRQKHLMLNQAISLDAPKYNGERETLSESIVIPQPELESVDVSHFLSELKKQCTGLERSVLSMYSAGYSFAEMAAELGRTMKTVDNAIWRIKVKARRMRAEVVLAEFLD